MKKNNLLILAVAALGFAACTSDETTAVNEKLAESNVISFRPLVGGNMRTANSTGVKASFEAGDIINVYANYYNGSANVKYFQADFTKSSEEPYTFTSSPGKYYWPTGISSTNTMTFTAIWGATQVAGSAGQIASMEIPGNKDILVARHVSTTAEATPVLNFRHALAQVLVKVKNTNPALKIVITDFQVGYVDKTGAFDFDRTSASAATDVQEAENDGNSGNITTSATLIPAAKWSNTAATAPTSNYSQNLGSSVTFTGTNGGSADNEVVTLGSPWILLPQTRAASDAGYVTNQSGSVTNSSLPDINKPYLAVKMTIKNNSTGEEIIASERWCCWPVSITWNPGYKYTYTIDVANGGYEPIDTNNDGNLDPVLGNVIVFAPNCTIDYWVVSNSDVSF